jgi:hypothetical protein
MPARSLRRLHRRKPFSLPRLSLLEERLLLSGAPGPFARLDGGLAPLQGVGTTEIHIAAPDFSLARGHVLIGLEVQGDSGTGAPRLLRIVPQGGATDQIVPLRGRSGAGAGAGTGETLVRFSPGTFSLVVGSNNGAAGSYHISAFLAGAATGDDQVTARDLNLIRRLRGVPSTDPRYQPGADVNGNGVIDPTDLQLARQNLGAATRIRPLSVTLGLDPASGPDAQGEVTAAGLTVTGQTMPGATVRLAQGAGGPSGQMTTADPTGGYHFTINAALGANPLLVQAADGFGQSATASLTVIRTSQTPVPASTQAGPLMVESLSPGSVSPQNVTITGAVPASIPAAALQAQVDGAPPINVALDPSGSFRFTTTLPLDGSADGTHTVRFTATDSAGNSTGFASASFTLDTRAPQVTLATATPAPGVATAINPTLTGQVADATSGVATLEAQVDSGPFTPLTVDAAGRFQLVTALPLDGSADGLHTVTFRATDLAGNVSGLTSASFTLDTAAPQVTLTTPASSAPANTNPSLIGRVSDATSGVAAVQAEVDSNPFETVSVDATGQFQFTPALPLDGSADGLHTVHFRAIDLAGNVSGLVSDTFTLDTRAPQVVLPGPVPSGAIDTNPAIAGRATDANSGIATVQAQVDSGPFNAVSLDASGQFRLVTTLPLDGSADGSHTVHIVAQDLAGNSSTPVEFSFVLDTRPPTIDLASPAPGSVTAASPILQGTVTDAGSGVASLQVQVDSSSPVAATVDPATGAFVFPTNLATGGTEDGTHTVQLRAVDRAGNVSNSTALSFVLDSTPPAITITSPSTAVATDSNLTIMGQVADQLSGVASLSAQVDQGPVVAVTPDPAGVFQFPVNLPLDGTSDGTHSVVFQALDKAGNSAAPATVQFTLDTTPPLLSVLSPVAGQATSTNVLVAGRVADGLSGVAALRAQVDSGPLVPVGFDSTGAYHFTTKFPLDGSADGAHSIQLQATDQAGNVTIHGPIAFTLDTQPPAIVVSSPPPGRATCHNVNVVGQVTDSLSGVTALQASLDSGQFFPVDFDAAGNFSVPTSLALDGTADGPHTVHLQAVDQAGNRTRVLDEPFVLDTQSPAISIVSPEGGLAVDDNVLVTLHVADALSGVAAVAAQVDSGPIVPVVLSAPGTYQFRTELSLDGTADGAHTVQFQATDRAGNVSAPVPLSFTLDTRAPSFVITSPPPGQATSHNITVVGQVTASDLLGVASLETSLDRGPFAPVAIDAAGHFSVATTLPLGGVADGPHTVRLQAVDKTGNVSKELDIPFVLDSQPPVLSIASPGAGLVTHDNITVSGHVADAGTGVATLQARVDSGPLTPVEIDPDGSFQLNTQLSLDGSADGVHTILLEAADAVGNTARPAQVSFTLDTQPPTLVISGPPPGETANQNITVVGTVSDKLSGVASLQASVDSSPFVPVAHDTSGAFSFPTLFLLQGSADGPHTVHLRAVDQAGNTSAVVDEPFVLDTLPPTVTINSPAPGTILATKTNVIAVGHVADGISGVASLFGQVDAGPLTPVTFNATGDFQFSTQLSLDGTADGMHTVQFEAIDRVGNVAYPTGAAVSFVLDTQPPVIVLSGPAPGLITSTNITATGRVSDTLTSVVLLQAQVDSGPLTDVSYGPSGLFQFVTSLALDGSADGPHTLHLRGTDLAGNISSSTDLSFTLETRPHIAILSPAPDSATHTNITIHGRVTAGPSGIASLTEAFDGGAPAPLAVDSQGNFLVTTALSLDGSADGDHAVILIATDRAGQTSDPAVFPFIIDTRPPALAITGPPGLVTTQTNITINGQATDALSGVASVQAAVDSGPFAPVGFDASGSFHFLTALALDGTADGIHTVLFQAADKAGNTVDAPFSFTLLTHAPAAPVFALDPTANTGTSTDPATTAGVVTLIGHTDPGVTVTLAGPALQTLSSNTGTFQFTGVPLDLGANTFTAQAVDAAGTSSFSLTIQRQASAGQENEVLVWNQAVLSAIQTDASDPLVSSRGLAMVQAAVFDAVSAIEGTPGYGMQLTAPTGASADAAVASAAYTVLSYLYPAQQATFDALLASSLAQVPAGQSKSDGIALGQSAGNALIALRANDGSKAFVDYVPGSGPGVWVPTPPMYLDALDPQWATVQTWTMTSPSQFRPGGPPALDSQAWADALNKTESLGSATSTTRTADQTQIARFWSDNSGSYTPPGHWNQIAEQAAQQTGDSLAEDARLFAVLDITLADAGIACWDAKYAYNAWRPVTAIQNAGTAGNPNVQADPNWTPLLITPNFPEYDSGHSTFSAAAATVLDAFFGTSYSFSTTSVTLPGVTRSFNSFDQAAAEAGESRIYAGIHFEFSNQDGQAAGRALASYALNYFNIAQDTTPPKVTLDNVLPAGASNHNITLTGQVTDNLSGPASMTVQVDQGNVQMISFDAGGHFTVPTGFALDGTADGTHTLTLVARDFAGNASAPVVFSFVLDTRAPTISLTSPANNDALAAGAVLAGTVTTSGAKLTALCYAFDGGTSMPVSFDATGAFNEALDLSRLTAGPHTLTVKAQDAAGNTTSTTLSLTQAAAIPLTITSVAPENGADQVGVSFRPKVVFSRPIDPTTLNSNDFFAADSTGTPLPAAIVPSQDGTFAWLFFTTAMPGASTITLTVDGSGIKASDGSLLDAAGNGTPGSLLTTTFTTVNQAAVPGTSLTGILADPGPDLKPGTFDDVRPGPDGVLATGDDIYLNPIAGAKVYILGLEDQAVYTDSQGRFTFDAVPTGDIKLAIDGRTATNAPTGVFFPEMVMDLTIKPGQVNTVMGSMGSRDQTTAQANVLGVYLPRLQSSILQTVSNTQPTMISTPVQAAPDLTPLQRQLLTLEVMPGSAMGADGKPMNNVQVGVSTVPTVLIRDMLPAGVQQPLVTITVQAPGVATFSTPIAVTYPNVYNEPPGTKLNFISFDHTTGRLEIEGTATVSADGQSVVTDPGVGITHPGWHLVQVGTPTAGMPCTDSMCVQVDNAREGDVFKVDIHGTVAGSSEPDKANFTLDDFSLGTWAKEADGSVLTDGNDPFSSSGVFYFVPTIQLYADQVGPLQAASGHFHATLYRTNPTTGAEESTTEEGIIRIDLVNSYSTSGDGAVPTGAVDPTDRLDVYQVQQRLRYFGYQNQTGATAQPVEVDGSFGAHTMHAMGVFDAAAENLRRVNEQTTTIDPFINATNAPRWVEFTFPVGGITDHEQNPEHWMTSWERDSLNATNDAYDPNILFNGTSPRGGGNAPPHRSHQYGMDLDIGLTAQEQQNAQAHLNSTGPLTALEQSVLDRMLAFWDNSTVPIQTIILEYPRINSAFNAETGTNTVISLGTNVHKNHFHIHFMHPDIAQGPNAAVSQDAETLSTTLSTSPGFGTNPQIFYRITLANGFQVAGQLMPNQSLSTILQPNVDYTLTAYQPSSNRSVVYQGHTSASGVVTNLGPIILDQFGGPDSDGDGIPDVGEYAIGTNPNEYSTTGDGISDGAKLAAGLDPLDGHAFPTGVIATLPTSGSVEKLAVDGNTIYAAGSGGLTIVDGSQFKSPIIQGHLTLPGSATGVGVDDNLEIAAVATGSALQLVDVSNARAPRRIQSVSVPAAQVVVAGGVAYAASGPALNAVDLLSGKVLQTLTLPGSGTVTGMARDGTMLYAFVSGSDTFVTIDISTQGAAVVRGQTTISIASFDVGVFAANGIAWLAGSGLRSVDVSDPTQPKLIHGADFFFNNRRVALNGSGLAITAPDGNQYIEVYDASNPNVTANRLLQIPLSGPARDVAISRGIAYVGEGNRIEVVNYLPFDTKGVPPTATLSTSAADVDVVTPGLQVLEGTTLPLQVNVADDVQVRDVALLVNGQVVQDVVSYPFNLSAIAPNIAAGSTTFTLQVRATDTGGNVGLSNVLTIGLVSDTSPPTISSFNPASGTSSVEGLQTVSVRFSKPLAAATVTTANFLLADNLGRTITPSNLQLLNDGRLVQLSYAPLVAGTYTLTINGPAVTDRVGNPLSPGIIGNDFTLTPRETLTVTNTDADPVTPGLQLFEGTTVKGTIGVDPSVTLQRIDLLENGQVISTSSTTPLSFSFIAPLLSAGAGSFTLEARVTDTNGFTTLSTILNVGLLKDVTPPTLVSTSPANNSLTLEGLQTVTATFSKPIAAASAIAANFQVVGAGPDGVFGDGDDVAIPLATIQRQTDDTQIILTTSGRLQAGAYELIINGPAVTDRPGNPLSAGLVIKNFTLTRRATLTTSITDADPATPGIQTYEGTTIPLSVTVASGVTVRTVALSVNGQSVATLSSSPYSFTFIAPSLASGVSTLAFQASITDTTGFTTTTSVLSIGLLRDQTPPTIVSTSPANGSVLSQAPSSLTITFSKPIARSSLGTSNVQLLSAGPDGTFGDSDDVSIPITALQFLSDDTQVQLSVGTLAAGSYELILHKDGITDRVGNPLGTGTFLSAFSLLQSTDLVTNGGFETGSFSGWTVVNSGSGAFSTYSGTTSPISGYTIPAPAGGSFAALTDQPGPGSHLLYQNLAIPAGVPSATLAFDIFVANRNGTFYSPASLSESVTPNQQARVDIMTTSSSTSDVGAGVLRNLFQTQPGSTAVTGWTHYTFDVSAFAGSTIRLRFAEVDNQFYFQFGVDNVSLKIGTGSSPATTLPEGSAGAPGTGSSQVVAAALMGAIPSSEAPAGQSGLPSVYPAPILGLDGAAVDILLSSPDLTGLLFDPDQDASPVNDSTPLTALADRARRRV